MTEGGLMPAAFFGHGNPMNALEVNRYTAAWRAFGSAVPRPRAILVVSAHWYINATAVTAMPRPRTIHDFYGFPQALFDVHYPAPGLPELAAEVADVVHPTWVGADLDSWGIDHGTWSVLMHVYPKADIPVVQLSIDEAKAASWHFETAKKLAPLRDEGVLIVGSGNLVHNLHTYSWGNRAVEPYDWAERFEALARKTISRADFVRLVDYESLGRDAMLSVPTPDHYLPLLYVLAQHRPDDAVSFPVEGFDGGSISMLGIRLG